jgi:hypothetical protein
MSVAEMTTPSDEALMRRFCSTGLVLRVVAIACAMPKPSANASRLPFISIKAPPSNADTVHEFEVFLSYLNPKPYRLLFSLKTDYIEGLKPCKHNIYISPALSLHLLGSGG